MLNAATVNAGDLSIGPDRLINYADSEYSKQSATSVENSLVALDRLLSVSALDRYDALWRSARACSWLAQEFWADRTERAKYAYKGVEYARAAIKLDDKRVEGEYYLGTNLGQWATTRTIGAHELVPQVVDAGKQAMRVDEHYDHAGPLRLVGSVYAKAPPWPVSVGDTEQGVKYLARAVRLAYEYPLNHLLYADALAADGNDRQAVREYQLVVKAAPAPGWAHFLPRWKSEAAEALKKLKAPAEAAAVGQHLSAHR